MGLWLWRHPNDGALKGERLMKRRTLLLVAGAGLATGCSTTSSSSNPADKKREIDTGVDKALADLFRETPIARDYASKAQGVLVFPSVVSAGFMVGGSYGQGSLRKGSTTLGYYSVGSGSVGLLAGAETKAMYLMFMTAEALQKFQASKGWTAGADASVTMADKDAAAHADTLARGATVIGFVRGQKGLMANLSLEGTKISKLDL
jgi:lipid-binding SYLF domain-containing protein